MNSSGGFALVRRLASEVASVQRIGGFRLAAAYVGRIAVHAPAVLRTRTLAPVDDAMGGGEYRLRVFGEPIVLAGASFGLAREIYGRRSYLRRPGFFFTSTDDVVDLGAHAGTFTLLAARFARRVVAVEADPGWIERLSANVERNGVADKVAIEHGAVGVPIGGAPFVTMDELVERHRLDAIDFLKLDIEGAEFELLTDDAAWLQRVGRIAMEVHPEAGSVGALAGTLERAGFAVSVTDAGGRPARELRDPGYLFAMRA